MWIFSKKAATISRRRLSIFKFSKLLPFQQLPRNYQSLNLARAFADGH